MRPGLWTTLSATFRRLSQNLAGPLIVEALRPLTDAPLDTHLMIVEPEQRVSKPQVVLWLLMDFLHLFSTLSQTALHVQHLSRDLTAGYSGPLPV